MALWSPGERGTALAKASSLWSTAKTKLGFLIYFLASIILLLSAYAVAFTIDTLIRPGLESVRRSVLDIDRRARNCLAAMPVDTFCSRAILTGRRYVDGVPIIATDSRLAIRTVEGVRVVKADDIFGVMDVPGAPRLDRTKR